MKTESIDSKTVAEIYSRILGGVLAGGCAPDDAIVVTEELLEKMLCRLKLKRGPASRTVGGSDHPST